jgi:hypothetical protein
MMRVSPTSGSGSGFGGSGVGGSGETVPPSARFGGSVFASVLFVEQALARQPCRSGLIQGVEHTEVVLSILDPR